MTARAWLLTLLKVVAQLLALTIFFTSREASPFQVPSDASAAPRQIVAAGQLAELRWPNFSNYQARVKTFYESSADALAWIQSGAPTPQALSLIEALQHADNKGLHAEDYDGPRWADRLARVYGNSRPPPPRHALTQPSPYVSCVMFPTCTLEGLIPGTFGPTSTGARSV